MRKPKRKRTTKTVLRLPDLEHSKTAVLLAAGIRRVKGVRKHGVRIGNWLTIDQGHTRLQAFDRTTLRGKRDYAMIAVLLGCGLRRAELAAVTLADLQRREEHWVATSGPFQFQIGSAPPFRHG
jgi:integrase